MKTSYRSSLLMALSVCLCSTTSAMAGSDVAKEVNITPDLFSVDVTHNGRPVTIQRNQDKTHRIKAELALTSRECPPHCVQPISVAPGVETIGELEVLAVLQQIATGDQTVLLIDTRSPEMIAKGTIPGSINVFGNNLMMEKAGDPITVEEIFTNQFGVKTNDGLWDFDDVKTLVLYCYGIWCGQAPRTAKALIRLGYPAHKLKWYRGGLQAWESLGLTVIP